MSNDEFQMKGFWDKKPTQSKVFKPNEIIGFLMVNTGRVQRYACIGR